jgi:hypothetical protein
MVISLMFTKIRWLLLYQYSKELVFKKALRCNEENLKDKELYDREIPKERDDHLSIGKTLLK